MACTSSPFSWALAAGAHRVSTVAQLRGALSWRSMLGSVWYMHPSVHGPAACTSLWPHQHIEVMTPRARTFRGCDAGKVNALGQQLAVAALRCDAPVLQHRNVVCRGQVLRLVRHLCTHTNASAAGSEACCHNALGFCRTAAMSSCSVLSTCVCVCSSPSVASVCDLV